MRITLFSDYALRLLMHVALHPAERVTIARVATAFGISRHHLTKVAHQLALAGLLRSSQGRGGGLRLARPAAEITLAEVLRITERGAPLVECFDPATNHCVITPACRLQHALAAAEAAFYAALERRSLQELVAEPAPLLALLRVA